MTDKELSTILSEHKRWLDCIRSRKRPYEGSMADLSKADLSDRNLLGVDLSGAFLYKTNFGGADLHGANLPYADLTGANLVDTNLVGVNFHCATLSGTCLDPAAQPNGDVDGFTLVDGYVIGYRTRDAGHIDEYRDNRCYSADVFSVAPTACHPGLYLWPTLRQAFFWTRHVELIQVRTRPADVHHAGGKWRCRWFEVLGTASTDDIRLEGDDA